MSDYNEDHYEQTLIQLFKNKTNDWQRKESARAGMRKLVKRLLKKYKYPPAEAEYAMDIVLKQCEEWTDDEESTAMEVFMQPVYDILDMAAEGLDEPEKICTLAE